MNGTATVGPWQPRGIVLALCALALTLYLTLNSFALQAIGVHYEADGGNPLIKIHPGTYLIVCAVLIHFLTRSHPMRMLEQIALGSPGLCFCGFGMLIVLVFAVSLHGLSGVAYIVDTYVAPAFLAILLARAPARFLRPLFVWMLAILVANACLGIVEARLHWHVFPYVIDGVPVTEDFFRATALEGHPLRNAMLTGLAIVAVSAAPWPIMIRFALQGPLAMGMLAFGGRTALIVAVLACASILFFEFSSRMRRAPDAAMREVWAVFALLLVAAAVLGVVFSATDFGGRIRAGDFTDSSSAARLQLFNVFKLIDLEGLFAGYDSKTIDGMTRVSGLLAIENFWVFNFLFLGIVCFLLWIAALSGALAALWQRSGFAVRVTLVAFLAIASSNNSLAKKDSSLSIAFAFLFAAEAMVRSPHRELQFQVDPGVLPHVA